MKKIILFVVLFGALIVLAIGNNISIQSQIKTAVSNERALQAQRDELLTAAVKFEIEVLHYRDHWHKRLIELTKDRQETVDEERQATLDKQIDEVYFEIGVANGATLIELQDLQLAIPGSSLEEQDSLRGDLRSLKAEAENEFPQWHEILDKKLLPLGE